MGVPIAAAGNGCCGACSPTPTASVGNERVRFYKGVAWTWELLPASLVGPDGGHGTVNALDSNLPPPGPGLLLDDAVARFVKAQRIRTRCPN